MDKNSVYSNFNDHSSQQIPSTFNSAAKPPANSLSSTEVESFQKNRKFIHKKLYKKPITKLIKASNLQFLHFLTRFKFSSHFI